MMIKIDSYPEYKESGIPWVGEIPLNWTKTKVANVFNITLGKMVQPKPYSKHDVLTPYLKAVNVQEEYIDVSQVNEMYATLDEIKELSVRQGDLLVSEGGDVARSSIVRKGYDGYIFQNSLHRVRGGLKGISDYLHYLLITIRGSGYIDVLVNKATISHFTKSKFSNLKICLPSYEEQQSIVAFLNQKTSEIDALIADKERLIELLEEKKQAVIIETVTKGLDPDIVMKNSGLEWLGNVPKHWRKSKLKHIANIIAGQSPESNSYNHEGLGFPFLQGSADFGDMYPHTSHYTSNPKKTSEKNDILISVRAPVGDLNFSDKVYCLGRGLAAVRANNMTNYHFLYFLLKGYNEEINSFATGSTFKAVSNQTLANINIFTPPLKEQMKIADHLYAFDKQIDETIVKILEQINKLKEYRQSLVYEAVTGKIDVRDYVLRGR